MKKGKRPQLSFLPTSRDDGPQSGFPSDRVSLHGTFEGHDACHTLFQLLLAEGTVLRMYRKKAKSMDSSSPASPTSTRRPDEPWLK